jgi:hypothetical protein
MTERPNHPPADEAVDILSSSYLWLGCRMLMNSELASFTFCFEVWAFGKFLPTQILSATVFHQVSDNLLLKYRVDRWEAHFIFAIFRVE